MARRTLLLGSLPSDDTEQAMSWALRELAPHLPYLPDGEPGDRARWVIRLIDRLRDVPSLQVKREGNWSDYQDQLNFRVRKGHSFTAADLHPPLVEDFEASYSDFRRLREEFDRPDLPFQVGVPGDFDAALFSFGPLWALRRREPFTAALAREITAIHEQAGRDVLFQIEVPVEQVLVAKAPKPLHGPLAAIMAGKVVGMAKRAPAGARFGVHLCLGDLEHQSLGTLSDAAPLAALANAVASRWPAGPVLEYVHAPLAEGMRPPAVREAFYRPLSRLRLPAEVRFVAGFLHEGLSFDEAERILGWVESAAGRQVDVAASCGLGRRDADAARTTMRQGARLCEQSG